MFLLDTNVISEFTRPHPAPAVAAWMRTQPRSELWTASIVVAELLSGIELLPAGRKKQALRESVEKAIAIDFRGQILKFDVPAARAYGRILSTRQQMGRPIREMDAMIAAIALANGAALATRNTPDFEHCGIHLLNPWQ
jgi:predicted nucleic acid-binding protein